MITYDLKCRNGHRFEGWFESRESFERQLESSLVACPVCDDKEITRQPSLVSVHVGKADSNAKGADPKVEALSFFRELSAFMEKNFEDLGTDFTKEALKMKSGEAASRSIRGTTTPEDEETLTEEGIEFMKIPLPKYDA